MFPKRSVIVLWSVLITTLIYNATFRTSVTAMECRDTSDRDWDFNKALGSKILDAALKDLYMLNPCKTHPNQAVQ